MSDARPLGEMEGGDSCQLDAPGIGHDQLGAPAHRPFDTGADHRVLLGGIGADDEKGLCLGQILDAVGHRAAAEGAPRPDTDGACQRRAQWSTLLVPITARASFCMR